MTKKDIVPKELDGLTLKQRRFIKFYLKSGNGTNAAMRAYDCKDRAVAGVISAQNLVKLKEPVKMLMEARGLSIGRLLDVLDEGLKADRIISAVKGKEATGATNDFIEVPDHKTRHKYLETAAKWLGIEKENIPDVSITSSQFNFFSISEDEKDNFNEKFIKFIRNEDSVAGELVPEVRKISS